MKNIIVTIPKKGDIVCIDNKKQVQFIDLESFSLADLSAGWETVGPVAYRNGDQVLIMHKDTASKTWSDIYSFRLTGYTLDGTERTGVFTIYTAASTHSDVTFTYNASTVSAFATQLRTFFAENTTEAESWQVVVNSDDTIDIIMLYTYGDQRNNTAKSGLTMTANLMSDVASLARIRRKNGYIGGEGAISSWYRALAYFRADNSSTSYNPSSEASLRRNYPICLPGYLGTSQYQTDHCSALRAKYGQGEEGWLKFMESCRPCLPSLVGNMAMRDGKALTYAIARHTYVAADGTTKPVSQAAAYATAVGYDADGLRVGDWSLPTIEDLAFMLEDVKYNSHSTDRNSDPINKALYRLGKTAFSNGSFYWSCCRGSAGYAWVAFGYGGFFGGNGMYNSFGVRPVSLYTLKFN